MSGYEDMKGLFEGAGLGVPPVPEHLRPDVRELRPWTFATFDIGADDLYDLDGVLRGAVDRRDDDSFAVGHVGHGVNSYAIGYQVVTRWFVVVLQLAWGGVYMDAEKTTGEVRRSFGAVGSVLSLRPPASVAGQLVVVSADFRQVNAIGWLGSGELVDVRGWAQEHATADPIETARAWAVEEGWASGPTGDEAHDRDVWKPDHADQGTARRTVLVPATMPGPAMSLAERRNPGWTAVDARQAEHPPEREGSKSEFEVAMEHRQETTSVAERRFRAAVRALIARGENPGPAAIYRELGWGRSSRTHMNGPEFSWRASELTAAGWEYVGRSRHDRSEDDARKPMKGPRTAWAPKAENT
jgi:hypothetical protein